MNEKLILADLNCHTDCTELICPGCGYSAGTDHWREDAGEGELARWGGINGHEGDECPSCSDWAQPATAEAGELADWERELLGLLEA